MRTDAPFRALAPIVTAGLAVVLATGCVPEDTRSLAAAVPTPASAPEVSSPAAPTSPVAVAPSAEVPSVSAPSAFPVVPPAPILTPVSPPPAPAAPTAAASVTESAASPGSGDAPSREGARPSRGGVRPAPAPAAPQPPSGSSGYAAELVTGVNAQRAAAGVAPLQTSACAAAAAQRWAEHLSASGAFEHQDIGAVMRGCSASGVAENIAQTSDDAGQMVSMWMGSAGHRKNMLNGAYTHVGSAAVRGADGQWTGVQVFLRL